MVDYSLSEQVQTNCIMIQKKSILSLSLLILFTFYCCESNDDASSLINNVNVDFIGTYGGSLNDSGQSVISTNDGGYAVLGYSQSMDGDITDKQDESFDYWLLKFNTLNELEWQKTYGGDASDKGSTVIQTQDGGYAILGSSFSTNGDITNNNGSGDYWLAKLDSGGTIIWQKSFGFQGNDSGISVLQTNDQGYLITGILDVTASGGQGNSNRSSASHAGGEYWAIRLNTNGDLLWSKFFGGTFTDTPEGVVQTDDGSFIIAGGSDSSDVDVNGNIGSYDFWVIKISSAGELIWEKSYGGNDIDNARGIVASDDGNFVIVGDTRSNDNDVSTNNGAADLWLIKISPDGDLLWEKTIGGTNFDVGRAIKKTQDNGFILSGSSRSNTIDVSVNNGQNDAWAVKVDSNGNLLWEKSIGGSNIDFAYGVAELNDQSIIVVGDSTSDDGDITENKGFTDLLLIKID